MASTTGHSKNFSLLPSEMRFQPSVTVDGNQRQALTQSITPKEHTWQCRQVLFEDERRERMAPQQIQHTGIDGKSSVATPSPGSPGTFVMPLSLRNETKEEQSRVFSGIQSNVSNAKANHSWTVLPDYPLQIIYASQGVTGHYGKKGHSKAGLPLWITPVAHRPENTQVTPRSPATPTGLFKRSAHDSALISGLTETRPSALKMKQRLCSAMTSMKDRTPLLPVTVQEPPIPAFKYRKSFVVVASAVATFFILLLMDILA